MSAKAYVIRDSNNAEFPYLCDVKISPGGCSFGWIDQIEGAIFFPTEGHAAKFCDYVRMEGKMAFYTSHEVERVLIDGVQVQ